MASGAQIEQQINVNYDAIDKVAAKLAKQPPMVEQLMLQKELQRLWQAQQYWANQYHKVTGKSIVLFKDIQIKGTLEEEKKAAAAQKDWDSAKRRLKEGIDEVDRQYASIIARLQDQYDISTTMGNALFSHWTRMGAGLHARHPLIVRKEIMDKVPNLLAEARKHLANGKLDKAWPKVSSAAAKVKWGFDFLNWWMDQLEKGSKRAEAGIKVSAALAALVVAAPLELGILGTMAVASVGEGAQQGTTLALKGIDDGETVSAEDVKKAFLETLIAGGTAGIGKGVADKVARGLAARVGLYIFKRKPTRAEVAFIKARIEQYLAANSAAIAKKLLALDTEPDWNWWYMIITPMINPVAMEMAKEPELNKLLKE